MLLFKGGSVVCFRWKLVVVGVFCGCDVSMMWVVVDELDMMMIFVVVSVRKGMLILCCSVFLWWL